MRSHTCPHGVSLPVLSGLPPHSPVFWGQVKPWVLIWSFTPTSDDENNGFVFFVHSLQVQSPWRQAFYTCCFVSIRSCLDPS